MVLSRRGLAGLARYLGLAGVGLYRNRHCQQRTCRTVSSQRGNRGSTGRASTHIDNCRCQTGFVRPVRALTFCSYRFVSPRASPPYTGIWLSAGRDSFGASGAIPRVTLIANVLHHGKGFVRAKRIDCGRIVACIAEREVIGKTTVPGPRRCRSSVADDALVS
jgi:hypothetical protein